MRNNGLAENTIISIGRILRKISKHADLTKPEQVKEYIATAIKQD